MSLATIPVTSFKYSIKSRLAALTKEEQDRIKDEVCKNAEVSHVQNKRYILLKKTDKSDVPARVLREYAKCFGITTDELYNA